MKIYELHPIDGRASFYGKARVIIDENSVETLVSYNTPIMRRLPDGKLEKLWDGWTQTTGRHIKAFCGMDKKQYQALQKAVQIMLTAQLYGKTISGKTIAEIKRKASRIANGFQNAFDCMKVTDQEIGLECTFWRYNRKSPNNTIVFGKWQ